MATVRIEFTTDNAALDHNDSAGYCAELEGILEQAHEALCRPCLPAALRDSTGNTVGRVTVEE